MQLLESAHTARRSRATTALSVVAHVAVLAVAVRQTAQAGFAPEPAPTQRVLYVAPRPVPPDVAPAPRRAASASPSPTSSPLPAPPTIHPIDVQVTVPDGLPPIETRLGDPSQGIVERLARGVGERGARAGDGGGEPEVYTEAVVERAVVAVPGVAPRYPEMLRGQGVEGRVVARFIVDTTGRVEKGSVQIVSAAHPAFEDAVRRVLPAMRFRPAEARGRRVRQLVDMPFEFVLNR